MTSIQLRAALLLRKFRELVRAELDVDLTCKKAEATNAKKQNAGTHEAFRRLNYAFRTLVGKGDAKSRHPEILIVAAVTRFEFESVIEHDGAANRNSEECEYV